MIALADAVPGRVWFGFVVFVVAIGPLSAIAVRDAWRGRGRWGDPPGHMPGGPGVWTALARALPSFTASLTSGVLLVPLMAVTDDIGPATALIAIVLAAGAVAGLLLGVCAILFGRPRFVIPPPRRQDRSAVGGMVHRARGGDRRPARERG